MTASAVVQPADYPSPDTLIKEAKTRFDAEGYVLVRDFAPPFLLARFREHYRHAMRRALRGIPGTETDDLDTLYRLLSAHKPEHAQVLLNLGRDMPSFYTLLGWMAEHPLVQALVGSHEQQVVHDNALVRVDAPGRDETGFEWHQYYPYNMTSTSAVTAWCPLLPVTPEMGLLKLIPRSHREFLPVTIDRRPPAGRNVVQRKLRITGLDERLGEFEARAVTLPPVAAGDTLFFHSHLLHASGINRSERCRWVFNGRFGDMLDDAVVERRWYTTRVKYLHLVADIHPDKVTRME